VEKMRFSLNPLVLLSSKSTPKPTKGLPIVSLVEMKPPCNAIMLSYHNANLTRFKAYLRLNYD
jgi:hypothetical protein